MMTETIMMVMIFLLSSCFQTTTTVIRLNFKMLLDQGKFLLSIHLSVCPRPPIHISIFEYIFDMISSLSFNRMIDGRVFRISYYILMCTPGKTYGSTSKQNIRAVLRAQYIHLNILFNEFDITYWRTTSMLRNRSSGTRWLRLSLTTLSSWFGSKIPSCLNMFVFLQIGSIT